MSPPRADPAALLAQLEGALALAPWALVGLAVLAIAVPALWHAAADGHRMGVAAWVRRYIR